MSLIKNLFGKKDEPIKTYSDFWNWFQKNERNFFKVINDHNNIEKDFFDIIDPKLRELKEGFYYLTGMKDTNTAELVITAEGDIKNIVFVEELIASAPKLNGWLFTALKPALRIEDVNIKMAGYEFNPKTLNFYSNDDPKYPDEISITVVHSEFDKGDKSAIKSGSFIFLDNYLGELHFATTIDNINIIGNREAIKELVPINKLKDYLIWREKEFIEKYEGVRHDTQNDEHFIYESKLANDRGLIAVINRELLSWEAKASHPWIAQIDIKYDGENFNGMPDQSLRDLLTEIEENILEQLKDSDGYLHIGRQTGNNVKEIYFACKDFRRPSKVIDNVLSNYLKGIEVHYEIYKDKYWRSFNRFLPH